MCACSGGEYVCGRMAKGGQKASICYDLYAGVSTKAELFRLFTVMNSVASLVCNIICGLEKYLLLQYFIIQT